MFNPAFRRVFLSTGELFPDFTQSVSGLCRNALQLRRKADFPATREFLTLNSSLGTWKFLVEPWILLLMVDNDDCLVVGLRHGAGEVIDGFQEFLNSLFGFAFCF